MEMLNLSKILIFRAIKKYSWNYGGLANIILWLQKNKISTFTSIKGLNKNCSSLVEKC